MALLLTIGENLKPRSNSPNEKVEQQKLYKSFQNPKPKNNVFRETQSEDDSIPIDPSVDVDPYVRSILGHANKVFAQQKEGILTDNLLYQ